MHIAEETFRVLLNLLDFEAVGGILASRWINNTSLERTLQTANAATLITLSGSLGVREGKTWWAGLALWCLVNMGGSVSRRLVRSTEAVEVDVIAYGILLAVNREVVIADRTLDIMLVNAMIVRLSGSYR